MNVNLRAGLHSGQQYAHVCEVVGLWQSAEDLGYEWVSLFDHWRPQVGAPNGPCLDSTVTATAGLLATRQIMGALMVAPAHAYDPGRLAMRAVALQQASRGRFTLGLGAGGADNAYREFGIVRPSREERLAALGEVAALVPRLIMGEEVTNEGHYRLNHARVRPSGGAVPIAIGGASRPLLELAGRHADVWNTLATDPHSFAADLAVVRRAATSAGRDPDAVRPSLTFRAVIGTPEQVERQRAELLARQGPTAPDLSEYVSWGSEADCVRALKPYVRAGALDLVLAARPPLDQVTIEAFVARVMPRLREIVSR